MSDHAQNLRQAADEIRREGHAGWGNACEWAADEIERLRDLVAGFDDGGHWYSQQTMDAVVRERDDLRRQLAEAELDAERYRWLRLRDNMAGVNIMTSVFEPDALDAAIDAHVEAQAAEIERLRGLLCKCGKGTRLVGDGCEFCNPDLADELYKEQR